MVYAHLSAYTFNKDVGASYRVCYFIPYMGRVFFASFNFNADMGCGYGKASKRRRGKRKEDKRGKPRVLRKNANFYVSHRKKN